jgi:ABC-2 type transport system ATP-binding protein
MMNNAIHVRDLVVVRSGTTVLPGLDLTVRAGSVTGLLGPSGCGKTTLIRCLAGVQVLRSGSVTVLGEPAGSPANRTRVGYVTQASSVYPDLTVRQNLSYFAAIYGRHATAVTQALEHVGLADRSASLTGRLSGGQRTRVSLAAALLTEPEVLLLDEPTVGLDPVLRRDLWALFADLAARGCTLLVSSHVMDEAGRCDEVLLLRDGRLLVQATPDQLRQDAGTDDLEEAFLTLAERSAA